MQARIRVDTGAGIPVLYIPGIDGTGDLLLGTAPRIALEFRLTRLRYQYQSGHRNPSNGFVGYPGLARSIAEICAELRIDACLVLAESFGGAVALQLALDFPGLVRGLMIVNSFASYPSRLRLALLRLLSPLVPRFAFRLGRHSFANHSLFGSRGDAAVIADFRALGGAFFDSGYRQRLSMIAGLDLRPRLPDLEQPVALFAGDQDRIVASLHTMTEMAQGLPDATLEIVEGGGHLILPLASEPWVARLKDLARRADL